MPTPAQWMALGAAMVCAQACFVNAMARAGIILAGAALLAWREARLTPA